MPISFVETKTFERITTWSVLVVSVTTEDLDRDEHIDVDYEVHRLSRSGVEYVDMK